MVRPFTNRIADYPHRNIVAGDLRIQGIVESAQIVIVRHPALAVVTALTLGVGLGIGLGVLLQPFVANRNCRS